MKTLSRMISSGCVFLPLLLSCRLRSLQPPIFVIRALLARSTLATPPACKPSVTGCRDDDDKDEGDESGALCLALLCGVRELPRRVVVVLPLTLALAPAPGQKEAALSKHMLRCRDFFIVSSNIGAIRPSLSTSSSPSQPAHGRRMTKRVPVLAAFM
ncbi:hypothetical protein AC579_3959 [Pseudocercospora musae]|uniref:Uncharacterized protein n=1 Tax=Pseudocercospora musae TaxID=113226 RepID=A0A139I1U8_9PEZI|nr:hypothetical protein AC579_3959 [Pseudocercospora musae]